MLNLMKNTTINDSHLPAVQEAVRKAFRRHQINNTTIYGSSSDSDDGVLRAASHTLQLYRKTKPTDNEYHLMAQKIQASYRAYGVRRRYKNNKVSVDKNKIEKKNIHFDIQINESDVSPTQSHLNICNISSSSLAGSHLSLPKYKPYSVHNSITLGELDKTPDREHTVTDYTNNLNTTSYNNVYRRRNINVDNDAKTFRNDDNENINDSREDIDDVVIDADDDSERSIEEIFTKHCRSDDD
ncbi:uncharacterized protein LOC131843378 [Achroia grisella]|uniref:uncharacterized protein LOC131843378 n=1 Tax=Achroia grisella TaxID=688607 RepID=UPI0027D215C3|nr:uncharacterized protein LOC131843378 [Achroia grisella]